MTKEIYQGNLISGKDLEKEYKKRKKDYEEKHIKHGKPISKGWEATELKSYIKLKRPLPISTLLENDIWCMFYEFGLHQMSSSHFQLNISENDRKQIDILAIDDDVVFIVECKTNEKIGEKKDLKAEIRRFHSDMSDISKCLWNILGEKLKPIFVIATYNILWRDDQKEVAKRKKIHIFDEYDILVLRDLGKLAGNAAKYLLYNEIFYGKKIDQFQVQIPAIESIMQQKKYYTFNMLPQHLLKIAFVHRRKKSSIPFQELSNSYQRMLNARRVKEITSFLDNGGFFPGNIIINFQHHLKVETIGGKPRFKKNIVGKTRPVIITLPPYYGSAWVIDGQHRLYGYADSDHRNIDTIPVTAFVKEENQAEIFFNINSNQKPIDKNLLWDLYEDLYQDSNDSKEKHLQSISILAKKLNSIKNSPFYKKIKVPYLGNEGIIDLKTICNAINRHRLIYEEEGPLYSKDYATTIDFAAERINDFFNLFATYLKKLWLKGKEGFLLSTAGIGVLFAMYSDLITNLKKQEIISKKKHNDFWDEIMLPVIEHLDMQDASTLKDYISRSVGRAQSTDLQVEFTELIVKSRRKGTFNSPFWKKYQERPNIRAETSFLDLVTKEENQTLEFKGSFKLDVDNLIKGNGKPIIKSEIAKQGVVKAVASFLNTEGGDVIIGLVEKQFYLEVERDNLDFEPYNNFYILGIEEEFKASRKMDKEKYSNALIEFLDVSFGFKYPFKLTFQTFMSRTLCRISVDSTTLDCYVDERIFYGRRGAKTDRLNGKEIQLHNTKYKT